ncbi:hypothetical protein SUGI_0252930 [Cryptomeria japonica]|nr:hypothetical protein SUGI_0252930 [Cryptomeria japonica]
MHFCYTWNESQEEGVHLPLPLPLQDEEKKISSKIVRRCAEVCEILLLRGSAKACPRIQKDPNFCYFKT